MKYIANGNYSIIQNVETTPMLMEVVERDMHLKIVVNVHLATQRTRMENAKKVRSSIFFHAW